MQRLPVDLNNTLASELYKCLQRNFMVTQCQEIGEILWYDTNISFEIGDRIGD